MCLFVIISISLAVRARISTVSTVMTRSRESRMMRLRVVSETRGAVLPTPLGRAANFVSRL